MEGRKNQTMQTSIVPFYSNYCASIYRIDLLCNGTAFPVAHDFLSV